MADIVLTGGLAVYLYRWCIPDTTIDLPPLMTFDIDWAVPERFPQPCDVSIHSKLTDAGFVVSRSGSEAIPVTRYYLDHHGRNFAAPIYLEFIAPREGSRRSRSGKNQAIIEVEPNLHAQTDPYLELLLVENLTVDASRITSLEIKDQISIRLPNPAFLVMQKLLIRKRREMHKRANDVAHLYDVAIATRPIWQELADAAARTEKGGRFPAVWFSNARKLGSGIFANPEASGPIEIARVYRDAVGQTKAPKEKAIHAVMSTFLETLGLVQSR